jgi:hypothetical protein
MNTQKATTTTLSMDDAAEQIDRLTRTVLKAAMTATEPRMERRLMRGVRHLTCAAQEVREAFSDDLEALDTIDERLRELKVQMLNNGQIR